MAALQDWGGVWRFAYSHHVEYVADTAVRRPGFLDLASDPLSLSAERAALCLFLRGDMAPLPSEDRLALWVTDESALRDGKALSAAPPWRDIAWSVRVASCLSPDDAGATVLRREEVETAEPPPGAAAHGHARPSELSLRLDRERGAFAIVTLRTCGGFAERGRIDAGPLTARLSPATPTAIWASSLDGRPLPESRRILLAHLTDVQSDGAVFDDEALRVIREWGTRPLARVGKADVELKLAFPPISNAQQSSMPPHVNPFQVFALSSSGARRFEVPVAFDSATGVLSFTASVRGEDGNAVLEYEIMREQWDLEQLR